MKALDTLERELHRLIEASTQVKAERDALLALVRDLLDPFEVSDAKIRARALLAQIDK